MNPTWEVKTEDFRGLKENAGIRRCLPLSSLISFEYFMINLQKNSQLRMPDKVTVNKDHRGHEDRE